MKVILTDDAKKELKKLDKPVAKRITSYLHEVEKLEDPRMRGKGLTGDKAGLWRYRVGDYRIVCEIKDDILLVTVVKVGHRKEIYI